MPRLGEDEVRDIIDRLTERGLRRGPADAPLVLVDSKWDEEDHCFDSMIKVVDWNDARDAMPDGLALTVSKGLSIPGYVPVIVFVDGVLDGLWSARLDAANAAVNAMGGEG